MDAIFLCVFANQSEPRTVEERITGLCLDSQCSMQAGRLIVVVPVLPVGLHSRP